VIWFIEVLVLNIRCTTKLKIYPVQNVFSIGISLAILSGMVIHVRHEAMVIHVRHEAMVYEAIVLTELSSIM